MRRWLREPIVDAMDEQPLPSGPVAALGSSYGALRAVVATVTDEHSWTPTACVGWSVRDLVFHCLQDAQRGLVALHTPAQHSTDRDAVTYWEDWSPGGEGAANGRRHARVSASMFLHVEQLLDLYQETTGAVVHAARSTPPETVVATQGHVLTAGDLMCTLAVEATIHHLDLAVSLPDAPGPAAAGLTEVRRVLDGMLGRQAPSTWDGARYARMATGRATPSRPNRSGSAPTSPVYPCSADQRACT